MARLLHLDSSARRRSFSRQLTERFAARWAAADPGGTYEYRDLAAEPVPPIGQAWTEICDYLLAHRVTAIERFGEAVRTQEQKVAWDVVEPLLDELVRADVVLVGAPMYNYSIPAALKAWLDQVTFPRMSLAGRSFVVVNARGGSYLPGAPKARYDYQERYLRDFLAGHFAVEDVTFVDSELTNALVDPVLDDLRGAQVASHDAARMRVDAVVADLSARHAVRSPA
ncbi:MAG: FMN-dependent NADH-azoreductase [Streptosporangiales bacterium]|nr:FMN-dependent NADH-azoreductase [Streptosporangiales bacterium]